MPASWTSITSDDDQMELYVAHPASEGPHPAVIVVQEIWGLNAYVQSVSNKLAAEGYFAVAPALYHREGPGTIGLFEETDLAFERLGRLRDDQILADLRATVSFIHAQSNVTSERIGIIGFCVGGRISYLAAANLDGLSTAVDFYGGRCFVGFGTDTSPFDLTQNIRVPLLGLFGEDDQNPTTDEVEQMKRNLTEHGKEFEFHVYPGAGHAFNCEERPTYRRDAALHAWKRTLSWFETHLRN